MRVTLYVCVCVCVCVWVIWRKDAASDIFLIFFVPSWDKERDEQKWKASSLL